MYTARRINEDGGNIHTNVYRIFFVSILVFFVFAKCKAQISDTLAFSRYNDNFIALSKDSSHKFTLLPESKALYLGKDKTSYIGFGGEAREQVQVFYNEAWVKNANSGNPYILQRLMFHINAQVTKHFRFFGDISSSIEKGRSTGPRPGIDVDKLDIRQAFADVIFVQSDTASIILRAGRQEMNYGSGRLVNNNEGQNVKLAFQGLKLITRFRNVKTDIFYMSAVNNLPGFFDNGIANSTRLFGLYSTINKAFIPGCAFDFYALGYHNNQSYYVRDTARENRYSLGARIYGNALHSFAYEIEGTYQFGEIGNAPISAYMVVGRFAYSLKNPVSRPSVSLVAQFASGDKTGKSLNTYNPLYARVYYGIGVPYWSANLFQIAPTFEIKPIKALTIDCAIHSFWRSNTSDGLYIGNSLTRSPYKSGTAIFSDKRFMGFQFQLNPVFMVTRYFSVSADVTVVPASEYIRETGPVETLFFSDVQMQFKF